MRNYYEDKYLKLPINRSKWNLNKPYNKDNVDKYLKWQGFSNREKALLNKFSFVFCKSIQNNSSCFCGGVWKNEEFIIIGWGNFLYNILISLGFSSEDSMKAKWGLFLSKQYPEKEKNYIRNYVRLANFTLQNVLNALRNKIIAEKINKRLNSITKNNNQELIINHLSKELHCNWNIW